jgi:hypothetical protein
MKTPRIIIALTLALGLLISPLFALTKQVTTVGATASIIVTPGYQCAWVTIANTGAGAVMLSFDGTNPTATVGFPLAAGGSICVVFGGSGTKNVVKAILQTATTTTLNINTPDLASQ